MIGAIGTWGALHASFMRQRSDMYAASEQARVSEREREREREIYFYLLERIKRELAGKM